MRGYKDVTNEIVDRLNRGTIPWRQTWKSGLPTNAISKRPYKGINTWLLGNHDYQSNLWLTFNQAKGLGGWVRKGEHGRAIVFWKIIQVTEEETEEEKTVPLLRTYTVFNVEQTTVEFEVKAVEPIMEAQQIVDGYSGKPPIRTGEPAYHPTTDTITIPPISSFNLPGEYYSTLFHELSHSTGAESRLDRKLTNHYGSDPYAEEEAIAEMSASYLSAMAGTQVYSKTIDNTVAYIQFWTGRFRDNDRLIISLSSQAQRSADWILGKRNDEATQASKEE